MGLIRRRANRWLAFLLTAASTSWVSAAVAQPEPEQPDYRGGAYFHPDLEHAIADWSAASGAAGYTALRAIWQTWDRAEPAQVEEALREAALAPRLSPPLRTYAELLSAYARLRRGDATEAQRRIAALGYVDQWLVLGPFDNTGKTGLNATQGPEPELAEPIEWGRGYPGKDGRQVRWRVVPPAFPYGWVDAGALLRPKQQMCVFFASYVTQPKLAARRPITLWVGARGAYRLFWNGVERLSDSAYRGHDFDRRAVPVWLEPGENRVTVKLCGDDAAPMLSLRLADPRGTPDAALRWHADINALTGPAPPAQGTPPPSQSSGPLDSFEHEARSKSASPGLREAFARYLQVSDGDDPATHQARDLAYAAAATPTVPRLLLAADLADDRNERAHWLERARAALVHSPPAARRRELGDLLIAEAHQAEQGSSPQLALPLYDQALVLDPDDVDAIAGKARLYEAAGLKRSARAIIDRGLERNPHAVSLLNLSTSGLSDLGQTETARGVESLYSALRFDDHGPLVDALQFAVQGRDRESAEHWVNRLSVLSPDSPWASSVAAHAYRSFGDPERAMKSYDRALALAPEDTDVLRELADLQGELGQGEAQLGLLRRILGLAPQNGDVRQYVDSLEPSLDRTEETYAWKPERFLEKRFEPARGQHRRTLVDLTVTHLYENGLAGQFRQIVFQPLTDTGAAMGRQYAFTFQADRQRAQLRGARVYRSNGSVDEAIESAEGPADDPDLSMYTSARTVYVQFPRLEPGDVVELQYRVDDVGERGEFAGYFGELEYLQSEEPIGHAEYVVITPKDRPLYVDAERVPGLQQNIEVRAGEQVHVFSADAVPGVNSEPAMPPWPEVLGFVHVSTYPSYKDLGAWYWGLSRDQLVLDGTTRELVHHITEGATTTAEKVAAVYDWVVKNTRYVALEFGIYGYKPRASAQTVARGWGDCKDKAAVLVSMLGELGIRSTMVLVRSGMRGRFHSEVASLAPFDHAIAYVPELNLYLDGTAEFSGVHELPGMDQGALALQVNQGDSKLVTLPDHDPATHVKERQVDVDLASNGSAELTLAYHTSGASASGWRRRYSAEATRRARVQEDLSHEFLGIELSDGAGALVMNDLSNFQEPVSLTVHARMPHALRNEGGAQSLPVTPGERLVQSFASQARRELDVDIGAFPTLDETYRVHLPSGASVASVPLASSGESPFGKYSIEVQQTAKQVEVHSRLALSVSRVAPERYAEFRRFCLAADAAFEQRLVLGMPSR